MIIVNAIFHNSSYSSEELNATLSPRWCMQFNTWLSSCWPTVKSRSYSLSKYWFIALLELIVLLLAGISSFATVGFMLNWFLIVLSPVELLLILLFCSLSKCWFWCLVAFIHVILIECSFLLLVLLYWLILATKDRELGFSSWWSMDFNWSLDFRRSLIVLFCLTLTTELFEVLINNLWWCSSISDIFTWSLTVITIIRLFLIGWLKLIWFFLLRNQVIIPANTPLWVSTYFSI